MMALGACSTTSSERGGPDDVDGGFLPSVNDAGEPGDATASADATPADGTPADAAPGPDPCASPAVESWSGLGRRYSYSDHIDATVTWTRTGTVGCVDTYQPSGTAEYEYYIPGALCAQSTTPGTHPVAPMEGVLTIDRSASPPTYSGQAATHWDIVFTLDCEDEPLQEMDRAGGGTWLDASGTVVDGAITGAFHVEFEDPDADARCGPGTRPCDYEWSFTAN
jgi:hypothetical protein